MGFYKPHSIITDKRTFLIYKNIASSFVIKAWTGLVQLLLVPMTLNCLNQYEYGVWLTISSFLLWIDTFDIGLGNGLRNKLAESLAMGDLARGRRQVSTTLAMLFMIVLPLVLIIFGIISQVDCYRLLNVKSDVITQLDGIIMCSVALVSAGFVFKFIGNIYLALQLPAINNLLVALGHTLALACLWGLSLCANVTLLHVALAYTVSPLVVYLLSFPVTFSRYPYLRPSPHCFDVHELRPLFALGVKFFMAQFAGLVIFASSNILISRLLSPSDVTPFQIAYRYFGITNILFTVISAPYWSATTEAYTKGDWAWITKSIARLRRVLLAFALLLLAMLLVSGSVYSLWVGSQVQIPYLLSATIMVYMGVVIYATCYSNMLCGIGKIYMLTLITTIEAVVYIPLAIAFAHLWGVTGIVMALVAVNIPSAVINRIQFVKICQHKVSGIWDK